MACCSDWAGLHEGAALGATGWRRLRGGASAVALAFLVACGQLPPQPDASSAGGTGEPIAKGVGADQKSQAPLRPLSRQPGTPADAPRSQVPMVRYDLAVGRSEDDPSPDDGVPGDEPPGEVFQRGGASWYGLQFHQRLTANGERFNMGAMTAAHKTLPFHSRVCVRSLVNGREVLVRVNDRGPFVPGRIIDLSQAAAEAIGLISLGIKQVALTLIGDDGGRCAGQEVAARDRDAEAQAAPAAPQRAASGKATGRKPARRTSPPRRGTSRR